MSNAQYEKLNMEGINASEGSFVKDLQGQTGVGFQEGQHVHKDWWAKTISYDVAMENIQNAQRQRVELTVEARNIRAANVDGKMRVCVGSDCFSPTSHALSQFSIRSEVPSSTILSKMNDQEGFDEQDADTMVQLFNNYARRLDQDKKFRLRTYTDGTLRAFLTEKYAIVDNRWFLDTLRTLVPNGRLSHWEGDEDTIYGNILLPDSIIDYSAHDDSDYGAMVAIGNCEIGKRVISQRPSIFRSICMNGCIWGEKGGKPINRRHVGEIDLYALKIDMAANIEYQLSLNTDIIRRFLDTAKAEYSFRGRSARAVIAVVCKTYKLTQKHAKEVISQWVEHESEQLTLFGVINAITRAGQKFTAMDWVKLDEVGGELANVGINKWEQYLKVADTLSDEDCFKVFNDEPV